ncbi:MAG: hypothetical protein VR72_06435 [Clostridiaceae bacterium BRH_c20a]|nr:MAG: hypothetical protein VR72_06435 [Clostridiaceae bacterium BRH_c20a]
MGIAIFPDDGDNIDELLKNADTAMYKAKELGKNNIQFFNKAMKEEILRKIDIENSLRTAMENQELFLEYQSLSTLWLPLNTMKIDKSFIADICLEANNSNLVEAIITIAHLMGLEITAEGVETKEQLDCLLQADCDGVQGYLFSKPISAIEVPLFLSAKGKL